MAKRLAMSYIGCVCVWKLGASEVQADIAPKVAQGGAVNDFNLCWVLCEGSLLAPWKTQTTTVCQHGMLHAPMSTTIQTRGAPMERV